MKKPEIIVKGDNPDCIHYEIVVGYIGTCRICGQVRDYRPCYGDDDIDTLLRAKSRRGQAVFRERLEAGVYGEIHYH